MEVFGDLRRFAYEFGAITPPFDIPEVATTAPGSRNCNQPVQYSHDFATGPFSDCAGVADEGRVADSDKYKCTRAQLLIQRIWADEAAATALCNFLFGAKYLVPLETTHFLL